MKILNLQVIEIEEREETKVKSTENIFYKIMNEFFSSQKKEMCFKVQKYTKYLVD